MNKHGICVVDDFLGKETGQQIGDEVRALHDTGKFTDGSWSARRVTRPRTSEAIRSPGSRARSPAAKPLGCS
nr:PNAS-118 [Homo sapiens]